MNRSDNIRLLQDLQHRRRRMAWRAGGMVAAIALSSCIGAGVAFADDTVVETADQQPQAALVQDAQGTTLEQLADASSVVDATDAAASSATAAENDTKADSTANSSDSLADDSSESSSALTLLNPQSASSTAADNGTLAEDSAVKDASGQTIEAFDLRKTAEDSDGTLTSKWSYTKGDSQSVIADGNSYVTPVKLQNPWGSCWAFSSTAASETSLLSELDKADNGKMDGSIDYTVASNWAKLDLADDGKMNGSIDYGSVSADLGLLAEQASDLSERFLAWYSFYDVAEDSIYPDQAGEGDYLLDGSKDIKKIYDAGGMPWLSMSEYSSGLGPVPEYLAPYISDEGYYQVPTPELDATGSDFVYMYFTSYADALTYKESTWTEETLAEFNEKNGLSVPMAALAVRKAGVGTWGLDESELLKEYESTPYITIAELSNSNVLDQNLRDKGLTVQEITLMKQELLAGHSISIGFAADQSKPGEQLTGNTYLNTDTWAQYTYENVQITHAVTIVGYDDNYAASNFRHTIYKTDEDGKLVVDEEKTALTTPAGNGAWIVKNSWGSLDAEDPSDVNNWGINGSGYFYLSYYDKTISHMESYEYDVTEEAQERLGYIAYQHDLANVSAYSQKSTSGVSKMCNIFDGPETGEGCISIRDLGFVTGYAGDTATLEVYVMDDDEDVVSVIQAGNPVVTVTQAFDNAGYHRIHLDTALKILPNQKFAIVQTIKEVDNDYEYVIMDYINEEYANAYNAVFAPLGQTQVSWYLQTVVNAGESLILRDGGSWQDWLDVSKLIDAETTVQEIKEVQEKASEYYAYEKVYRDAGATAKADAYHQVAVNCENFTVGSTYAYDNFSIKAYGDESNIAIKAIASDGVEQTDANQEALEKTCAAIADSLCNTGELPSNVKEIATGAVKRAINAGDGLIAELKAVKAAEGEVPSADKSLIALAVQSLASGDETTEVLEYFDIDCLLKSATTGELLATISQTDSPIAFAIDLDSDLLASIVGKDCYLVRIHDGASTFLESSIENGVLKFKSDLFSTYALAMVSEPSPEPEPSPNPVPEYDAQADITSQTQFSSYADGAVSPKTGDAMTSSATYAASTGLLGALLALCSGAMLRLRRRKA